MKLIILVLAFPIFAHAQQENRVTYEGILNDLERRKQYEELEQERDDRQFMNNILMDHARETRTEFQNERRRRSDTEFRQQLQEHRRQSQHLYDYLDQE